MRQKTCVSQSNQCAKPAVLVYLVVWMEKQHFFHKTLVHTTVSKSILQLTTSLPAMPSTSSPKETVSSTDSPLCFCTWHTVALFYTFTTNILVIFGEFAMDFANARGQKADPGIMAFWQITWLSGKYYCHVGEFFFQF